MAIIVDVTSTGLATFSDTLTWNHTCTNANLLVVEFWYANGDNITSVKYAGKDMLLAVKKGNGADYFSGIYYLQNPPQGTNSVEIVTTAINGIAGGSLSLINTSPAPLSVIGVTGDTVDTFTKTVTTQKDNSMLVDCGYTNTLIGDTMGSPTSPQTGIFSQTNAFSHSNGAGSYKLTTTAGSYTMSYSGTARTSFSSYCVAEIFEGYGSGNAIDLSGN